MTSDGERCGLVSWVLYPLCEEAVEGLLDLGGPAFDFGRETRFDVYSERSCGDFAAKVDGVVEQGCRIEIDGNVDFGVLE